MEIDNDHPSDTKIDGKSIQEIRADLSNRKLDNITDGQVVAAVDYYIELIKKLDIGKLHAYQGSLSRRKDQTNKSPVEQASISKGEEKLTTQELFKSVKKLIDIIPKPFGDTPIPTKAEKIKVIQSFIQIVKDVDPGDLNLLREQQQLSQNIVTTICENCSKEQINIIYEISALAELTKATLETTTPVEEEASTSGSYKQLIDSPTSMEIDNTPISSSSLSDQESINAAHRPLTSIITSQDASSSMQFDADSEVMPTPETPEEAIQEMAKKIRSNFESLEETLKKFYKHLKGKHNIEKRDYWYQGKQFYKGQKLLLETMNSLYFYLHYNIENDKNLVKSTLKILKYCEDFNNNKEEHTHNYYLLENTQKVSEKFKHILGNELMDMLVSEDKLIPEVEPYFSNEMTLKSLQDRIDILVDKVKALPRTALENLSNQLTNRQNQSLDRKNTQNQPWEATSEVTKNYRRLNKQLSNIRMILSFIENSEHIDKEETIKASRDLVKSLYKKNMYKFKSIRDFIDAFQKELNSIKLGNEVVSLDLEDFKDLELPWERNSKQNRNVFEVTKRPTEDHTSQRESLSRGENKAPDEVEKLLAEDHHMYLEESLSRGENKAPDEAEEVQSLTEEVRSLTLVGSQNDLSDILKRRFSQSTADPLMHHKPEEEIRDLLNNICGEESCQPH